MKKLLNEFIAFCDLANVTPAESAIDGFLVNIKNGYLYRDFIIKFCFYHWEKRNDVKFMNTLEL